MEVILRSSPFSLLQGALTPAEQKVFLKIQENKPPLRLLAHITCGMFPYWIGRGKPRQTRQMIKDRVYSSDHKINEEYRRYVKAEDFIRYGWKNYEKERWILYGKNLADPLLYHPFGLQKLLVKCSSKGALSVQLDTNGFLALHNIYMLNRRITILPLQSLLGILNSKLISWYFQKIYRADTEGAFRLALSNLPIATHSTTDVLSMQSLLNKTIRMISLHTELQISAIDEKKIELERQISHTDSEIDSLVYALYGLSAEEMKVVEGE